MVGSSNKLLHSQSVRGRLSAWLGATVSIPSALTFYSRTAVRGTWWGESEFSNKNVGWMEYEYGIYWNGYIMIHTYLIGGFKHEFYFPFHMGCHPSHWRVVHHFSGWTDDLPGTSHSWPQVSRLNSRSWCFNGGNDWNTWWEWLKHLFWFIIIIIVIHPDGGNRSRGWFSCIMDTRSWEMIFDVEAGAASIILVTERGIRNLQLAGSVDTCRGAPSTIRQWIENIQDYTRSS